MATVDPKIRDFAEFVTQQEKSANFEGQVNRMGMYFGQWRDGLADGNCMYRAVIAQLLDHYCNKLTPLRDFEIFYNRFRYQEFPLIGSGNGRDQLVESMILVVKVLWRLLELKRAGNQELLMELEKLHANEDLTLAFIYVLRSIAMQSILHFKLAPVYWEGCEEDLKETMSFGNLSGEQDFLGLSTGLDINIVQVTMGKNDYREVISVFTSQREATRAPRLVVNVALVTGHFYALYPKDFNSPEAQEKYHEIMTRLPEAS